MRQGKARWLNSPFSDPDRIKNRGTKIPYGARPDETETGGINKQDLNCKTRFHMTRLRA